MSRFNITLIFIVKYFSLTFDQSVDDYAKRLVFILLDRVPLGKTDNNFLKTHLKTITFKYNTSLNFSSLDQK